MLKLSRWSIYLGSQYFSENRSVPPNLHPEVLNYFSRCRRMYSCWRARMDAPRERLTSRSVHGWKRRGPWPSATGRWSATGSSRCTWRSGPSFYRAPLWQILITKLCTTGRCVCMYYTKWWPVVMSVWHGRSHCLLWTAMQCVLVAYVFGHSIAIQPAMIAWCSRCTSSTLVE